MMTNDTPTMPNETHPSSTVVETSQQRQLEIPLHGSVLTQSIGGNMQQPVHDDTDQRRANIAAAAQTILANVGEDPDREGLLKTPERFAKALQFFTSGYGMNPEVVTNDAIFTVDCNDIVVVQGIDVSSLCEHHLVPFVGKIHIGYKPRGQVLGLSKFVRIVEVYARRLQVQERLTKQVAEAIEQMLQPEGVVVMAECSHMCMSMRGVQQVGTVTTTLSRTGIFLRDAQMYEEFRSMLRR